MPGFPSRFLRAALGPKFVNSRPIESPESDIGDKQFNAAFWQLAGANLVLPRVSLIAHYTGGNFVYSQQAEAWNPDQAQPHPALARVSAGAYTYTFAASYLDEDGLAVPTVLRAPRLSCHKVLTAFTDRIEAHAFVDTIDPLVLQLRLWTGAAGTAVDEPFWLEAF